MANADDYAQWIVNNADKKGTPEFDIVAQAYSEAKGDKAAVSAGASLNDVGRQVGLTARYGLEGLANSAQLVTEPIRYATDRLTGQTGKTKPLGALATDAADWMGLPKPRNANERVVADATRLGFGTAATMGAGSIAQKGTGAIKAIGDMFTTAPVSQLASAAGSGLAGGASREAGGSEGQQVLSSVIGGLGGAGAVSLGNAAVNKTKSLTNRLMTPLQMDGQISGILQRAGVDYSQVPERIRQSLRSDLADALRADQELNPAAVARLLDFRANNLTPTRGMVTLDPVQITREMNLSKIGANSADGQLQGLARVQNQNNSQLISNLNNAGASTGNVNAAGEIVAGSVLGRQAGLRGNERSLWDAAKTSPGYKQPISAGPISEINAALGDEAMMPFMNPTISKYMEAFQTGEQPFTPQAYRNLQSMLAKEASAGGNAGAAASLAQRTLLASELKPAGFATDGMSLVTPKTAGAMRMADNAATESINAVNAARRATRDAYTYEGSSPLVRSVLSDSATSDPQRIAQRYIIGGTQREAADVASHLSPAGIEAIKNALVANLKEKALNSASDEVGKFSQSTFNKELNKLADSGKLRIFFSPEEITSLRSMGRAASYMQAQPVGSAVNNSNSGALLLGKGMDLLKQIPIVGPNVAPAFENMAINFRQRQAQNVLPGLLANQPRTPFLNSFAAPGVAMGGLLAAPGSNQ